MQAVVFKKDIRLDNGVLRKGYLYLYSDMVISELQKMFSKERYVEKDTAIIKNINEILPEFIYAETKKVSRVFLIRAGGIGDLIALSSLADYINLTYNCQVCFVTQKKYFALFDWFRASINVFDNDSPVAKYNMDFRMRPNRQLNFDGKIEFSNDNWFEIFFERFKDINLNYWGRPHLKIPFIDRYSNIDTYRPNILLCLKSTAWIRSISFRDVYTALIQSIHNLDIDIYVHEDQLNPPDKEFLKTLTDRRIKVIKAENLNEYLLDLYYAENVICCDTGALHFREGICKPALGIYAPFSSECRCKYYKFVDTIDIESPCKEQPCFKHCLHHDDKCENPQGIDYAGPCLSSKYNHTLIDQLINFFNLHLKI